MNRSPKWSSVLPALIIPLCLGMILYLGLSAAIERELITDATVLRYLTGHPISKVTLGLFFVGISSLALIGWNVASQIRSIDYLGDLIGADSAAVEAESNPNAEESTAVDTLSQSPEPRSSSGQVAEVESSRTESERQFDKKFELLANLNGASQQTYFAKRMQDAIDFRQRNSSQEGLEDELKYLSDLDQDRQSQRYSLVRILIWATPMLGFLGTVLGISQALGGISVGPENDFGQMMNGLRSSLYVAFDTTALALALSMVLMFAQFLVERFETQLLQMVDHRSKHLLISMFPFESSTLTKQELEETIVRSNDTLVRHQTELWRGTIQSAEQAWIDTLSAVNQEVQTSLTEAIDDSVSSLSDYLGQAIVRADDSMERRWQQWQVTLSDGARQLHQQQVEMNRQTDLMVRMLANSARLADAKVSPVAESTSQEKNIDTSLKMYSETASPGKASTKRMTSEAWGKFKQEVVVQKPGDSAESDSQPRATILKFPGQQPEENTKKAA